MSHPNPRHDPENSRSEDSLFSKARSLKSMIKEPASRKWFEKHGTPKSLALRKDKEMEKKVNAGTGRRLTKEESEFKTRDWPKSGKEPNHTDYQKRIGRAYNE